MTTLEDRALPDLMQSINNQTPKNRLHLVGVYGGVHDARAVMYLLRAYRQTPNAGMRCKILESIGKTRDPSVFDFLLRRLDDPEVAIRCYAIWALGELHTVRATEVLRLKLNDSDRYVQLTAIDALGKTGRDRDSAYALLALLRDPDVQRRYLAAKSLKGVASPTEVGDIYAQLNREDSLEVQEALAITLVNIGASSAVDRLMDLLTSSPSPDKQHWAVAGLSHADPAVLIPKISPWLDGSDLNLRLSALQVLTDLDLSGARLDGAWVSTIRTWTKAKDPERRLVAQALLDKVQAAQETETFRDLGSAR